MTKVCHLTSAHPWDDIRIFRKECVSLANQGYDVTLIAFGCTSCISDGVKVISAGIRPSGRIRRFLFSSKKIKTLANSTNAQIFHFHDPDLIGLGKKLAKKGKTVIYDVHEDVPRQLLDKPYLHPIIARILSRIFEKYENRAIKKYSAICCATPEIKKRFSELHPNVIDLNNYPLESEYIGETNISSHRQNKVCYIGAISEIRGLLPLIDALEHCGGIRLDLAGAFPEGKLKEKAKTSLGWKFVNELGLIDRQKALQIKSESMAGIVTFLPAANHVNAQPNKLFEYMASSLPVICSNFPLWKELIEKNNFGICVDPASPLQIAEAIQYIASNPEIAASMGNNANLAVIQTYNWPQEASKLFNLYSSFRFQSKEQLS